MRDRGSLAQLQGDGLTTAEVHYYRPDAPSLLQLYVWQEYDLAPDFPVLFDFLDHWRREIEARSEEHTSELQSLMRISYAVFCLKKKNQEHTHIKRENYRARTTQEMTTERSNN